MGGYNTLTGLEPGPGQQPELQQVLKTVEKPLIYLLTNSNHYFIECVYIRRENNQYRLVALNHGKVLYNNQYPTLRGCKIAFTKLFKERGWKEKITSNWSPDYTPETQWLVNHAVHLAS